jgi:hypothetical protein
MAAMAMSSSVAFKQGVSLGKSEFSGSALKQAAAASKGQNVAFAVRAAGYDAELIQTAVSLRSHDALCGCLTCIFLSGYSGAAMLVDVTHGIFSWYHLWQFQLVLPMGFSVSSGILHFIPGYRL